MSTFFDTADLRKKVPELTQTVINGIKKLANVSKLKHLAQSRLEDYSEKSYDSERDASPSNRILIKYRIVLPAEFNQKANASSALWN